MNRFPWAVKNQLKKTTLFFYVGYKLVLVEFVPRCSIFWYDCLPSLPFSHVFKNKTYPRGMGMNQ